MGVEMAALEVAALEVAALEVAALEVAALEVAALEVAALRSATSSTLVGSRGWETGMDEVLEEESRIWRFMGGASRQCVSQSVLDRSINEVHNQ